MRAKWIVVAAAVSICAGCISDSARVSIQRGRWKDYHDLKVGIAELVLKDQSAPQAIKDRYAECLADWTDGFLTPNERTMLDAYARGERQVTAGELRRLNDSIKARSGYAEITNSNIGLLSGTCPQDVPEFQRYLNLPS